jgi:hypothetical protein
MSAEQALEGKVAHGSNRTTQTHLDGVRTLQLEFGQKNSPANAMRRSAFACLTNPSPVAAKGVEAQFAWAA